jgi:hypothetical protein
VANVCCEAVQHERGPRHSTLRRQLALCLKNHTSDSTLSYTAAAAAAAVAMATAAAAHRLHPNGSVSLTNGFSPAPPTAAVAAAMQAALRCGGSDVMRVNGISNGFPMSGGVPYGGHATVTPVLTASTTVGPGQRSAADGHREVFGVYYQVYIYLRCMAYRALLN